MIPNSDESSSKKNLSSSEGGAAGASANGNGRDRSDRERGGDRDRGFDRGERSGGDRFERNERRAGAMEVVVDHNIEKAMKVLKRKLIKEGIFKELKLRRYFEKPSERKKRKVKESLKKARKEEARQKKNPFMA